MNSNYWFSIAELTIKLIFKEDGLNNLSLLPSFSPFEIAEPSKEDNLFELTIDDKTEKKRKSTAKDIFPIMMKDYWYVKLYILLYCLSPFINKMIDSFNKYEY